MTFMLYVIFISIHFVIICDVLPWRTYETHPTLSFKSRCDNRTGPMHLLAESMFAGLSVGSRTPARGG
jgi:hypothetical protein